MVKRTIVGFNIEEPEGGDEGQSEEKEIPMVYEFGEEDTAEVAFIGELGEESGGGATAGKLGIDGVDEVDREAERVDDDKNPFAHLVPPGTLLEMEGKEHEDNPEAVSVEDCRGVESQAASQDFTHGKLVPAHGEGTPVLEDKGYTGDHVEDIDECQVDEHCQNVAEGECFYFHTANFFVSGLYKLKLEIDKRL